MLENVIETYRKVSKIVIPVRPCSNWSVKDHGLSADDMEQLILNTKGQKGHRGFWRTICTYICSEVLIRLLIYIH